MSSFSFMDLFRLHGCFLVYFPPLILFLWFFNSSFSFLDTCTFGTNCTHFLGEQHLFDWNLLFSNLGCFRDFFLLLCLSLLVFLNFLLHRFWMSSRSHCLCLGFCMHLLVDLLSSGNNFFSSDLTLSTDLVVLHHHGSVSPFNSCSGLGGSNWKLSGFFSCNLSLIWDLNSLRFGINQLPSNKLSSSLGLIDSLLVYNVVLMNSSVLDFISDLFLSFVEGRFDALHILCSLFVIRLDILVGLPDLMFVKNSCFPCLGGYLNVLWLSSRSICGSDLDTSYLLFSYGFSLSFGCRCSSFFSLLNNCFRSSTRLLLGNRSLLNCLFCLYSVSICFSSSLLSLLSVNCFLFRNLNLFSFIWDFISTLAVLV